MFGDSNVRRWRTATRYGQAALAADDAATAARLFHEAVQEAEWLLCQRCEDLPTPRMYVVSCHNLAESYRRLGHLELVRQLLAQAHRRLLETVGEACLPEAVRRDCLEELSHSVLPLLVDLPASKNGPRAAGRRRAGHAGISGRRPTGPSRPGSPGGAACATTCRCR